MNLCWKLKSSETKHIHFICPTCRSTFRGAGTWRNCPETWLDCLHRSAALCHQGLQRRLPSQWHPEIVCSYHGWSRCYEHWPTGSCRMSNQGRSEAKPCRSHLWQVQKMFLLSVRKVWCVGRRRSPSCTLKIFLFQAVISPDQSIKWADIGRFHAMTMIV